MGFPIPKKIFKKINETSISAMSGVAAHLGLEGKKRGGQALGN